MYQGDITAILDASGTAVVRYTYDPWGKVTSVTNSAGVVDDNQRYIVKAR